MDATCLPAGSPQNKLKTMRRSTAAAAILLALLALSCLAEGRRSLKKSQAEKDAEALAEQQVRHCCDVFVGGAPPCGCTVQAARQLKTCSAGGKGAGPGQTRMPFCYGRKPFTHMQELCCLSAGIKPARVRHAPKHPAFTPPLPPPPPQ